MVGEEGSCGFVVEDIDTAALGMLALKLMKLETGTHIQEPVGEINVLNLVCMIPRSNRSKSSNSASPLLEILVLLQEDRGLNRTI